MPRHGGDPTLRPDGAVPEEEVDLYLAAEWGHEGEVTADRPFALHRLGEIGGSTVYEFFGGDHRELAFHGGS